jgi:hypothetical protein
MARIKCYVIRYTIIKNYLIWILLSVALLLTIIVGALSIDIRFISLLPAFSLPFLYLLYYHLYLRKCEIVLDYLNKKITIGTPFSQKTLNFNDVYITIKRRGLRTTSYLITIFNKSNKKIIKMDASYWDNIRYIVILPHKPNPILREFQSRWA